MKPLILIPGQFEDYKGNQVFPEKMPYEIILEQLSRNTCGFYILNAGTSTGKSSAFVNQLFLDAERENKSVIVTQPKVALCLNKMSDLPMFQKNLQPGKNLGYLCGNNVALLPTNPTSITFMTTEKFQQMLIKSIANGIDDLYKIKYVCIDEVHDISEQMIFTLLVIKQYKQAFPQSCQFIFMSATIDVPKFQKYFNMTPDDTNYGFIRPIQSKSYNRTLYYTDTIQKDSLKNNSLDEILPVYLTKAYEIITKEVKQQQENSERKMIFRDILIFCCNSAQIKTVLKIIEQNPPKFKYIGFSLTSGDVSAQNDSYKLYQDVEFDGTKIIVSTNLLEAGATIPRLLCMMDVGTRFYPVTDILNNESEQLIIPVSNSSKEQRIGRIGRNYDGYAFLMYKSQDDLGDDPSPMILPNQISLKIVYKLMQLSVQNIPFYQQIYTPMKFSIQSYPLLQNMSIDLLNKYIYQLKLLGVLDNNNFLTFFGIYCIYNQQDFVDVILKIFGANKKQMAICKAVFFSRMITSQRLTFLDAMFEGKPVNNYILPIDTISGVLEQAFCNYTDYYEKEDINENKMFNYRSFKKLMLEAKMI